MRNAQQPAVINWVEHMQATRRGITDDDRLRGLRIGKQGIQRLFEPNGNRLVFVGKLLGFVLGRIDPVQRNSQRLVIVKQEGFVILRQNSRPRFEPWSAPGQLPEKGLINLVLVAVKIGILKLETRGESQQQAGDQELARTTWDQ